MAIFFQSCPFECLYCHNPETIRMCVGCGKCVETCPVQALTMGENHKVVWDEKKCVQCDTCIKTCPNLSSPKIRWMTADDLLEFVPILTQVIPELMPSVGFQQHSPHHRYDVFTHTAHVVDAVPKELGLRWAALLHDVGKPACFTRDKNGRGHFKGHAKVSQELADRILLRLKAPTALRQQVTELVGLHMTKLEPDKKLLRRRLGKLGQERLEELLQLQEADMGSKGTGNPAEFEQFSLIRSLVEEILSEDACFSIKDLAINGWDLQQTGISPGPDIGKALSWLLGQVQDEVLPNQRETLLAAVKELLEDRT